jgi:hypothetical protein
LTEHVGVLARDTLGLLLTRSRPTGKSRAKIAKSLALDANDFALSLYAVFRVGTEGNQAAVREEAHTLRPPHAQEPRPQAKII